MGKTDREVLRELAYRYREAAASEVNQMRKALHYGVNDLKQIRPVVLIDEIPWNEFSELEDMKLLCTDQEYRNAEIYFRQKLYQWENFPCDMVLRNYLPVQKKISSTGLGLEIKEVVKATDNTNNVVSHEYIEQLDCPEQLELLHSPVITYEKEETERICDKLRECIGDILPVRPEGLEFHIHPWDDIICYRDFTNLLFDLIDEPEFMHATIQKMTEIYKDTLRQYEEQNLLKANGYEIHSTSALTHDLPKEGFDSEHVRAKDVWGRGAAQVFATVSAQMHEEFDIAYMKELMAPFGLNYYGCCEPLHNKIHIVEQIPNLRKISISPWADVDIASEVIGKKYVMAAKPNPANVASGHLDDEVIRKEISKILDASRRNQCACDIVLKDISTLSYHPENLIRWSQIVMELAEYY